MAILNRGVRLLRAGVITFRLALPKIGVGWMFALLTVDFNRVAIVELNVTAVAVTLMLAMHYFLSPFQVISGRIADRHPVLGYRRTPYLILAAIIGSLIFVALPSMALMMGDGLALGFLGGFGLLVIYGIVIAIMGDAHHSLIAEVVSPQSRGAVISVVWTLSIMSTILAVSVMNQVAPVYTPESMQRLYGLTPLIVIGSVLLGVVGIEKRLKGEALQAAVARSRTAAPSGNPLQAAVEVLRRNRQARAFFLFVFISIFSIFLQDPILEVFGAEVFGMLQEQTRQFQQMWGGGVLIGMLLMGAISAAFRISKRNITLAGTLGTAAGMALLASAALMGREALVTPSLVLMGLFTGFFNVGALSMMMDMTVEGATGLFMGLWGMAQAFGNGLAAFSGGALHTALIESGLLSPGMAYFSIFTIEAVGMVIAASLVVQLSVKTFQDTHSRQFSSADAVLAMEAGAAG